MLDKIKSFAGYFFIIVLALFYSCDGDKLIKPRHPEVESAAYAVPAWSPDGEWIAIAWYGDLAAVPWAIYMVRPDGSDLHPMAGSENLGQVIDLSWSPSGNWLAFTSPPYYGDIFKIKSNGDSLVRLTFTGDNFTCSWSRSDSLIAFNRIANEGYGIWLMNTNGNSKTHFIRYGSHIDFNNGDSLFYITFLNWDHLDSSRMNFISVSDSTERMIFKWKKGQPFTTYYDAAVSPDGNTIAFKIDEQIRTIDSEGNGITTLTTKKSAFPSWSPDGQRIVYCEYSDEPFGGIIRVMNADGTDNHVIVDWTEIMPNDSN